MNRYPLWKYLVIVAAIIFGIIYTLPNFFGESPAVQISSVRSTVKVDTQMMDRVERILRDNQIPVDGIYFDASGMHSTIKVRFTSTDIQTQYGSAGPDIQYRIQSVAQYAAMAPEPACVAHVSRS